MKNNMTDQAAPELLPNLAGFVGTNEQFLNALGVIASRSGADGTIAAVALEQLNRRADLAALSAPAEVEDLADEKFLRAYPEAVAAGRWEEVARLLSAKCRALEKKAAAANTALTALQARVTELEGVLSDMTESHDAALNHAASNEERAEKAEAERDELFAVVDHEISRSRRHLSAKTLAVHAKLKEEV